MTLTEALQQVYDFLGTPLGTLALMVLGGVAIYLRTRFTTSAKIEEAKAQAVVESNKNIEFIRKIADRFEQRAIDLESKNRELEADRMSLEQQLQDAIQTATEASAAAAAAKRKADEVGAAHMRTTENLAEANRQREAAQRKLEQREQETQQAITNLTGRMTILEQEREAALKLVEAKNGEIEHRDKLLLEREAALKESSEKVEELTRQLTETKTALDEVKRRLTLLEKHDTGKLPTQVETTNEEKKGSAPP